jgi:SAM-dependent methyltransferase
MEHEGSMPQDIFEAYAEEYDRWFDEHPDEYLAELSRLRQVLPAPDSRSIEVGVGSGRFAAPLGVTLGLEPSQALCRMARSRGVETIRGIVGALPIRDESCSSVLLVTVICFLGDPFPAFREIHRVLFPRGTLAIAFIERGGQIHRKYLKEEGKGRFLSHATFYSSDEVQTLLKDAGFRILRVDSRVGFCIIAAQKE